MKPLRSVVVGSSLVSVIVLGTPAHAAEVKKIAVPDMKLSGVEPSIGTTLVEVLLTEASRVPGVSVVSQSDILQVLNLEQQKQLVGCAEDESCAAQIGGALGVDYLLDSSAGKVGDTWILNMKLIDVRSVATVSRTYESVRGEPDALVSVLRTKVPELLAVLGPPPPVVWPMWTVIGAGAATMIVAGGLEIWASREAGRSAYEVGGAPLYSQDAPAHLEKAKKLSRWALGTGIAGALIVGGGVTWLLLRPAPAVESEAVVGPLLLDRGLGVTFTSTF